MKAEQLFDLMAAVKDDYITSAAERGNEKKRMTGYLKVGVTAAACLLIAVGAVLAGKWFAGQEGTYAESDTTSVRDPADADNGEFVIENGVLLSYCGTDTDVVLPDSVNAIASRTFTSSSNASAIRTIRLGTNVSSIDENAFGGLPSLSEVEVPDENGHFVFRDGVLMAADGSIHFSVTPENTVDVLKFVDVIYDMSKSVDFAGKKVKFVFDDVTVTAQNHISPDVPGETWFTLESFSAFGRTFNLKDSRFDSVYASGDVVYNKELTLQMTDSAFVYAKSYSSMGYYLIMTEGGVYEYDRPQQILPGSDEERENPTWYNDSVYRYSIDGRGRVAYIREPRKYTFDQNVNNELKYCTGLDEFALEEGYVIFDGGIPTHVAEKTYTVSETMNLNELFAQWYENGGTETKGFPDVGTLDELIAYNRERYQPAK